MTDAEYYDEVESLAREAKQRETEGDDLSDAVFEAVDNHQWIIYTSNHLDILKHSANESYGPSEGLMDLNASFHDGGLSAVTQGLAFWAMYADVLKETNYVVLDEEDEAEEESEVS